MSEASASPAAERSWPRPRPGRQVLRASTAVAVLVLLGWAWHGTEIRLERLGSSIPRLWEFLLRMLPPDTTVVGTVLDATLETLQIALLGTALSVAASMALGLCAAVTLAPPWIHNPVRWTLATLRAIPLILLALMFVSAVGLGPLPGVLAVAFHSTGMLGKFYAEAFESARRGPIEALDSVGANWVQRVRFGVLPQVAPDLTRDTLFRFELNLRESLILGLVGAGGIGFYIQLYARSFQYRKVATLTAIVLVLVLAVEQLSGVLRRRLR